MRRAGWLLLWGWLAAAAQAQVLTENAGVLSPETPSLRETLLFLRYSTLDELRWTQQLVMALDRAHELRLALPVVRKGQRVGLGDTVLRFKRSLWQQDGVMASDRWAVLAELTLPTGDTGAALPARLQIGGGNWVLGAGTVYTVIRDRHRFSAEAFYRQPLGADDRFGSTLDLNLAYWFRIAPAEFPPDEEPVEVRGVLELLSGYRWNSRGAGLPVGDNGWLVWLAPGLQVYPGEDVLLEGSVLVPLHQDLQDALGRREWGITGTIKILF
ncbi:MAG: hypothetical protein AB1758_19015 [Candidatus Eremiobacterota bacterium]